MTKITSTFLLRVASGVMLLHAFGHTLSIFTWQKSGGKIPAAVVYPMQETHFLFGGQDATMAQFFSGHGYAGTILLLLLSGLLWVLSGWTEKKVTKILWLAGLFILALALDELIFFFPMAVTFSLLAALLVFSAIYKISKTAL